MRASVNVAYLTQKIADCDSIVFPMWASGPFELDKLVPMLSAIVAIVVEGGDSSVRDPSSFDGAQCTHQDMVELTEHILLSRSPTSAPALFICLGHQLAAHAHITLLRKAVEQVLATESILANDDNKALNWFKRICQKIQSVGETLEIRKGGGKVVAKGWLHPEFAVAANKSKEVGDRQLLQYQSPDFKTSGIPEDVILAHELTADEHEGGIDTSVQYEHELNISMFHLDEVNEEAV
ncbi:MAG: hypothetical protein AAGB19_11405, partial [Cyanobacteria bacterium P01_F01_bin.3]